MTLAKTVQLSLVFLLLAAALFTAFSSPAPVGHHGFASHTEHGRISAVAAPNALACSGGSGNSCGSSIHRY
jgi:hypothetical protein